LSGVALIVAGLVSARSTPMVRRLTIAVEHRGPLAAPVRVALLSDIHMGNRAMDPARLGHIVDQVNAEKADIVLIAGDFVTGRDSIGAGARAVKLIAPLRRLKAPLGVIAVLGNHDQWTSPGEIRSALFAAHVTVLENEVAKRGGLVVAGLGDRYSSHDNVSLLLARARGVAGVPILLTHAPDALPEVPRTVAIVMAGHTHCGQIVLPVIGSLARFAALAHWRRLYDPHYQCGVVRDRGRVTVVTAGLGSGSVPLRIGAPPDWWLIDVRRVPPGR
jgi:uncharacterized protein